MVRRIGVVLTLLLALGLPTSAIFAGNVHFNGSITFASGSLTASGVLAGLGHEDVNVSLTGYGTGTATCTNRYGEEVPGANELPVESTGVTTLYNNGSDPFTVTAEDPPFPTPREAGCPRSHCRVVAFPVDWTSAVITVESVDTGELLLEQAYTCITTPDGVECTPVE